MSKKKTFLKIAVPIIVILLGAAIMKIMISGRQAPVKKVKAETGILVEVMPVQMQNVTVMVKGTGTVQASQEVSLIPQVSGRVVHASPGLVVGGFFKKGDLLFEIEDIDYRLALEQALSAKAKAEYDLATIESQARIARAEWEELHSDDEASPNPLVLYGPQLRSATAALSSAAAQLEQARLNLARTKITAPFNTRIRSENIDQGQYVRSGSSVAVLAGTDRAEITVPLSVDELVWIDIPGFGEKQNGASASVEMEIGNKSYMWKGHVVRTSGEVDVKTRMMEVVVEVKDPYGLQGADRPEYLPLAAGSFVDVLMKGKELKHVYVLPRSAFRDNSSVWVMDRNQTLRIQRVEVLKTERERVIIGQGLKEKEMVVLTNISGAADGMKLRIP